MRFSLLDPLLAVVTFVTGHDWRELPTREPSMEGVTSTEIERCINSTVTIKRRLDRASVSRPDTPAKGPETIVTL